PQRATDPTRPASVADSRVQPLPLPRLRAQRWSRAPSKCGRRALAFERGRAVSAPGRTHPPRTRSSGALPRRLGACRACEHKRVRWSVVNAHTLSPSCCLPTCATPRCRITPRSRTTPERRRPGCCGSPAHATESVSGDARVCARGVGLHTRTPCRPGPCVWHFTSTAF
ncbi:hypothetical protein B0H10DRAFT_2127540, partial [Mycena sp. CBHHK59/15]